MKKLQLSLGSIVYYKDSKAKIIKYVDMSSILIELIETNKTIVAAIQELSTKPTKEEIKVDYLVGYTENQWAEAKKRLDIIKPLLKKSRTSEDVQKISTQYNIHRSTIYRWIKLYEKAGELLVLVPKFTERGGKGKRRRIKKEVELIIDKVINELYLHKQKLTPKQIHFEIKRKCINAKLPIPHENTVRNRIKELPDKQVFKMRESKKCRKIIWEQRGKVPRWKCSYGSYTVRSYTH